MRRRRLGGGLCFYRCKDSVYQYLHKGYLKDIGEDGFFPAMPDVMHSIYFTLDPKVCLGCKQCIFTECHGAVMPDGEPWPEFAKRL